jgi:hypothetical protein
MKNILITAVIVGTVAATLIYFVGEKQRTAVSGGDNRQLI